MKTIHVKHSDPKKLSSSSVIDKIIWKRGNIIKDPYKPEILPFVNHAK